MILYGAVFEHIRSEVLDEIIFVIGEYKGEDDILKPIEGGIS